MSKLDNRKLQKIQFFDWCIRRVRFWIKKSGYRLVTPDGTVIDFSRSPYAMDIYEYIIHHINLKTDFAFPRMVTIAKAVGCTERCVRKWVKALKELGLLVVRRRGIRGLNFYNIPAKFAQTIKTAIDTGVNCLQNTIVQKVASVTNAVKGFLGKAKQAFNPYKPSHAELQQRVLAESAPYIENSHQATHHDPPDPPDTFLKQRNFHENKRPSIDEAGKYYAEKEKMYSLNPLQQQKSVLDSQYRTSGAGLERLRKAGKL